MTDVRSWVVMASLLAATSGWVAAAEPAAPAVLPKPAGATQAALPGATGVVDTKDAPPKGSGDAIAKGPGDGLAKGQGDAVASPSATQTTVQTNPPAHVEGSVRTGPAAGLSPDCNRPMTEPRINGGALTLDRGSRWQPRGGELKMTLRTAEILPSDALLKVCLRWKQEGDPSGGYTESPATRVIALNPSDRQSIKVGSIVPDLLDAPARDEREAHSGNRAAVRGVREGFSTVPAVDVRLLIYRTDAKDGGVSVLYDLQTVAGVTNVVLASSLSLATVVVPLIILASIARATLPGFGVGPLRRFLLVVSTPKGYASLSQLQIVVWTMVVAAATVYVMVLSGELIEITPGTLTLLGIAGGSTVLSKLQSGWDDAKEDKAAPPNAPGGAGEAAPGGAQGQQVAPAQPAPGPTIAVRAGGPRYSDLVINYERSAAGTAVADVDVTRVQMLLFTVVTAAFVVIQVATSFAIPEIPSGFLTLMGISNGVYLGGKLVGK
jgi:hypothetical protein